MNLAAQLVDEQPHVAVVVSPGRADGQTGWVIHCADRLWARGPQGGLPLVVRGAPHAAELVATAAGEEAVTVKMTASRRALPAELEPQVRALAEAAWRGPVLAISGSGGENALMTVLLLAAEALDQRWAVLVAGSSLQLTRHRPVRGEQSFANGREISRTLG